MQAMPVDYVGLAAVIMGCLMFLIPITAFSARFTIKPIVEALGKARELGNERETIQLLERRMALLEQEMHAMGELRDDVRRVLDEVQFHRQLEQPRDARG